ncbi:MAG: aminoglycoside phosphotransferase [Proteobacteria bacterium SG_bin6]|nr:MAG: aminoglycoside phosphotransferase [Proteobacteria bacterium SG_bin6]
MADVTPPAGARAFLDALGWRDATITPLAGDASFRRYFRVTASTRRAILMDAPPPHEDPRPFLKVAHWLHDRGFGAPEIYGEALDQGLVLLEDFGDDRMREAIDAGAPAEPLYATAVEMLVRLHREPAGPFAHHDLALLTQGTQTFAQWYCGTLGIDIAGYTEAWAQVLPGALPEVPVTTLRDYHAENLMLLPGGRLGLLDFQDATAGHPGYDLVSLLQDARRDVEPEIEAAMLDLYCRETGGAEAFRTAYHILGAQRNTRIIGVFTRLWKRDGKPRYPALCPRVWRYLERDLAHPALAPVKVWFDAHLPARLRGDPMLLSAQAA